MPELLQRVATTDCDSAHPLALNEPENEPEVKVRLKLPDTALPEIEL